MVEEGVVVVGEEVLVANSQMVDEEGREEDMEGVKGYCLVYLLSTCRGGIG